MVEASTFSPLANKYSVNGVPKIIINEEHELEGQQPLSNLLEIIEKI